eukprot:Awhi_evm1s238
MNALVKKDSLTNGNGVKDNYTDYLNSRIPHNQYNKFMGKDSNRHFKRTPDKVKVKTLTQHKKNDDYDDDDDNDENENEKKNEPITTRTPANYHEQRYVKSKDDDNVGDSDDNENNNNALNENIDFNEFLSDDDDDVNDVITGNLLERSHLNFPVCLPESDETNFLMNSSQGNGAGDTSFLEKTLLIPNSTFILENDCQDFSKKRIKF